MHVALMCTIGDFPKLGNLSERNTHIGHACHVCNFDFEPQHLPYSKKLCFMCHHHFLPQNHKFRFNRCQFKGNIELRKPPKRLTSFDIKNNLRTLMCNLGVKFWRMWEN